MLVQNAQSGKLISRKLSVSVLVTEYSRSSRKYSANAIAPSSVSSLAASGRIGGSSSTGSDTVSFGSEVSVVGVGDGSAVALAEGCNGVVGSEALGESEHPLMSNAAITRIETLVSNVLLETLNGKYVCEEWTLLSSGGCAGEDIGI